MNKMAGNNKSAAGTWSGRMLSDQINKYLLWMTEKGRASRTIESHESMLLHFKDFVRMDKSVNKDIFSKKYREKFYGHCCLKKAPPAINGFIRYLQEQKLIPGFKPALPDIFLSYLEYHRKVRQSGDKYNQHIGKVLIDFNMFLHANGMLLQDINIVTVDNFFSENKEIYSSSTCRDNRSVIRQFLRYLYFEKQILKKDLSALIVSVPNFAKDNPPKFLRPDEIKRLFESTDISTPKGLRDHAMLRLAYSTGLRPIEVSRITLDDISFKSGELTLRIRKGDNPVTFPLPEDTMKAITAYIIGSRPDTHERSLFVNLDPPHVSVYSKIVSKAIQFLMNKAGVPGTPYCLRHTYAQNLLESGASIFEIKEMLGHDCIKSTKRYLHVGISLMREVLLDD